MLSSTEIQSKPFLKLILIACCCVFFGLIFTIIASIITVFGFNIDLMNGYDYTNPQTIRALKLIQLLSAIGIFIVPSICYGYLINKNNVKTELGLKKINGFIPILLSVLILVTANPFISWLVELNESLHLPEALKSVEQWMKTSEESAKVITAAFLDITSFLDLLYTLLIIGVIPAVGEELLFRGVLQRIFTKWFKNTFLAILLASIVFSAFHLQFYGFLPRMVMGLLLGYLFYYSKSLWLPILVHFINNGSIVIIAYFNPEILNNTELYSLSNSPFAWVFYMLSLILTVILFIVLKQKSLDT